MRCFLSTATRKLTRRSLALIAVVGLSSQTLTACKDEEARDPCVNAQKTQSVPDDDARIALFNVSGTPDINAQFTGPNGQSQTCNNSSADVGAPTNVVFVVTVGSQVSVTLTRSGTTLGSRTCTVSSDIFDTGASGSPGNGDISFTVTGNQANIACGFGFASP
jgi:hypothetical protein